MGIRESINENPKVAGAIAGAVVVLALAFVLLKGGGEAAPAAAGGQTRVFFSSDDGKTWFADDAKKIPPFSKDGKEAVRAHVYQCPDGKQFTAWLERYTPEAKKQLEALQAKPANSPDLIPVNVIEPEVKAPGQRVWLKRSDPKASQIMTPKCPSGEPQLVNP